MRFPLSVSKKNGCQPWVERRCFDIACYTQSGTDELSQNDSSGLLCIDFSVAEKFGFVVKTLVGGYKLGPNLQFTLPDITYTDSTEPADPSMRSTYNWNGEHYVGI